LCNQIYCAVSSVSLEEVWCETSSSISCAYEERNWSAKEQKREQERMNINATSKQTGDKSKNSHLSPPEQFYLIFESLNCLGQ
jgi:hypothetical protein